MQDSDTYLHTLPTIHGANNVVFEHIINLIDSERIEDDNVVRDILKDMHHADLADLLNNTDTKTHKRIIDILGDALKAETLIWVSASTKYSIVSILQYEIISALVESLDTEDAIEVLEDFTEDIKTHIIQYLSREKRIQIIEGLTYPEHTVGRVMEKNFVSFFEHWTIGQSIDYIRRSKDTIHDFHAAIVVDVMHRPIGSVLLCDLLKHCRTRSVKEIMNDDLKIADTYTNLDQLSYVFKRYALTIVPIVNKVGKMVGTMSINNMLYIVEQQTEEEFMSLGGVHVRDTFHSLFYTAKNRFPWLFVNLITACFTSMVIGSFSDTIAQLISLAAIMPIVASIGGNAGTQVMTVTVMALVNKEINARNIAHVVSKELLVCGFNGFLLACAGGSAVLTLFGDIEISAIFGVAVVINFLAAGFFGSFIPIMLDRMRYDPASASAVLVTTVTDTFGFFLFLTLAYCFLV